jgi:hypothetical protein
MDIRRRTGRFERGEGPLENSYPLDEAQMLGLLGRLRQIPGGVVWGRRSYWPDGRFVRLSLGLEDEVESPTITVTVTHLSFHVEGYYRAPRAWFTVTSPDIDHTAQLVQAAFGWGQDSEKIVRDAIMETEREWLANPDWAASCLLSDSTRERKRWLFIRGELNFLWPHFPCRCGKSVNKFFDRLDLPRELPQRQGIKEARRLADAVAVCSTGACLARVASRLSNDYFSGRRTWHDLESTLTEEIHQHFADILRSLPALNQEALRRTRADETAALCRELLGNPFGRNRSSASEQPQDLKELAAFWG